MAKIIEEITISAPIERVYAAAKEPERFPAYVPDLKHAKVLERGEGYLVTEWCARISLGPIQRDVVWVERDEWDDARKVCRFTLIKGDMKTYSGLWVFQELIRPKARAESEAKSEVSPEESAIPQSGDEVEEQADASAPSLPILSAAGQQTRTLLEVDFVLGIPLLGETIQNMVTELMRKSCRSLLLGLKHMCETPD